MTRDAPREPRAWLLIALAMLVVATVYARALGAPFVWDDRYLIVDSQSVRHVDVIEAFTQRFWIGEPGHAGSLAYFRPLTTLSFALDYQLHAHNPAGYHLTNLFLHLVATGLVMGLLLRRGVGVALMFVFGLLWALLPRLTEVAGWISGRGDALAGLLALGALLVHRPGSWGRLTLAALLAFGALLAKESGFAALVALALLEWSGEGAAARGKRQRALRLVILVLPLLLYTALRVRAGVTSLGDGLPLGIGGRLMTCLEAAGRYAFMIVNPFQPRSFLGRLGHVESPYVVLGMLALVGLLLLARNFRRAARVTRVWLVFGLIPLLMVLHLTPLPLVTVAADRYLYLPVAALLVALAPAAQGLLATRPKLMLGLLILIGICGVRTFQRVGDYTDEALFWARSVDAASGHAIPSIELGSVAYRAGLFPEALALHEKALELDDLGSGRALDNATLLAAVTGQRELAARLGDELVARFPRHPSYRLRRASVALNAFDFDTAAAHAQRGLALDPGSLELRALLDLIRGAHQATLDPSTPAAVLHRFDIKAQRFPEVNGWLRKLLQGPSAFDDEVVRDGLELMVARGDPRVARQLLELYVGRSDSTDVGPLAEALKLRLETAANVQARLRELSERGGTSR